MDINPIDIQIKLERYMCVETKEIMNTRYCIGVPTILQACKLTDIMAIPHGAMEE